MGTQLPYQSLGEAHHVPAPGLTQIDDGNPRSPKLLLKHAAAVDTSTRTSQPLAASPWQRSRAALGPTRIEGARMNVIRTDQVAGLEWTNTYSLQP